MSALSRRKETTERMRHPSWELAEHLFELMLPGATRLTIDGLPLTPYEIWRPFDIEVCENDEVLAAYEAR